MNVEELMIAYLSPRPCQTMTGRWTVLVDGGEVDDWRISCTGMIAAPASRT